MVKEYYRRWAREHPQLQVYVSREEYNRIRELAKDMGLDIHTTSAYITAIKYLRLILRKHT